MKNDEDTFGFVFFYHVAPVLNNPGTEYLTNGKEVPAIVGLIANVVLVAPYPPVNKSFVATEKS